MHAALETRLAEVADLRAALALLEWDQETYMPPGAAEARASQVATLRALAHARFTDPQVGAWLAEAHTTTADLPTDHRDRALVRVTQRDYDRETKLPADLVRALALATSKALHAWQHARATDHFPTFAPHLETLLDLTRQKADALGATTPASRYDLLLDEYEPGMTAAAVAQVFDSLRADLVPLVQTLAAAPPVEDACLHQPYAEADQWAFGLAMAEAFGYRLSNGRLDKSTHPFSTAFSQYDCRITTRVHPTFFPTAFFGTLHETGHALYEQGFRADLYHTPLADGTSLGMHESQSRLWENLVGRSRAFWAYAYPLAQTRFPALHAVAEETFFRAINKVQPSLVRVEADEVTYHLHVMLRFDLERALIEGTLAVADLPEAWNARMAADLGLVPPSDRLGCLQDIHWSMGAFGYFPTYTLGTLMSAQLWQAMTRDLGDLDARLAVGDFAPLLAWLRTHIHAPGRIYTASQLLERTTGGVLDAGPWLSYAAQKFQGIYRV